MSFNLSATANDLLTRLGFVSWADATSATPAALTQAQVYGWFDEAQTKLATLGIFVDRNTQTIASATAGYALASDWLESVHVSIDGAVLRPSSTAELFALDSSWWQVACEPGEAPSRYSMDAGILGTITLYPVPAASAELETLDRITPATISAAQTTSPINALVSDYCLYFALMRARGDESPYRMADIYAMAAARVQMYEQIFEKYWGKAA